MKTNGSKGLVALHIHENRFKEGPDSIWFSGTTGALEVYNGMYKGYNDCFKDFVTGIVNSKGVLNESVIVCIAAVSLLTEIL